MVIPILCDFPREEECVSPPGALRIRVELEESLRSHKNQVGVP